MNSYNFVLKQESRLMLDSSSNNNYNIPVVITFDGEKQRKTIASMITEGRYSYFRRNITFQITENNSKIAIDILTKKINAIILYKTFAYFVKDPNILLNHTSQNIPEEVPIFSKKKRLFSIMDN